MYEYVHVTPLGAIYFSKNATPVDTLTADNQNDKKCFGDIRHFSKRKEDPSTSIDYEDLEAKARGGDLEAYDEMSAELLKKIFKEKNPDG